ncbi:MAG: hypothetical protein M3463_14380, partial [Verrucomicrobiota bacterium]|nr:hypothetical protein [Verrucomicrobiota bacterium]
MAEPTVTFAGVDTTTQGTWKAGGLFIEGKRVPGDGPGDYQPPAYLAITGVFALQVITWETNPDDPRAIQRGRPPAPDTWPWPEETGGPRIASAWAGEQVRINLDYNVADDEQNRFRLYFLDWDRQGRVQSV